MVSWAFIRQVGALQWALRYSTLQFRKRILRRDSELRLPTGSKMILPRQSRTSTEIYVTNANMDWGSETILVRFADPKRDFLDIGSHIGYYAAYLAPRVRCAYAFEPDPRNLPALHENARLATNIRVIEMAVSSPDGAGNFFPGANSSIGSLESIRGAPIRVAVTTVDTFVAHHPAIDEGLIKTDIDAHDLEVLRGMEGGVAKFQPLILTECELSAELAELCSNWRYKLYSNVRNRQTQRTQFREIHGEEAGRHWSKMLFLVPEVLQPDFAKLANN
jgi:FkbM family methyltransferase